jgi:hypothetical protein
MPKAVRAGASERIGNGAIDGAPGLNPIGNVYELSHEVATRLASEMGTDLEHAHRAVIAIGKVMQEMLLRGTPCGIPHLGIVHLVPTRGLAQFNISVAARTALSAGKPPASAVRPELRVSLHIPNDLRAYIADLAVYTGTWKDHARASRESRRLRKIPGKPDPVLHNLRKERKRHEQ